MPIGIGSLPVAERYRHPGAGIWASQPQGGCGGLTAPKYEAAYFAFVVAPEQIAVDDPRRPDVLVLLDRHRKFALAQTPPEHSFALDAEGLLDPAITVFSFRAHGSLLGIGAIKRLGPHHTEIKSMHTAEAARGRGIGQAMLTHLLEVARTRDFRRVSLETGTTAAFARARALYESAGFVPCGAFAGYRATEDNLFMTLELSAVPTAGRRRPPPGSPSNRHHECNRSSIRRGTDGHAANRSCRPYRRI